ncbi:MAG: chemotaxis protein CheD [Candidatus Marinimicrobia bacterium]|nr:chemotaxis protein CheD [Candidatus Neomarinimicrobiota bacterium]
MTERRKDERARYLSETAYHLHPGYIYYSSENIAIRTVVGNSVAVCLWDKKLKQGGMNHFLYPQIKDTEKSTPKYGNVATIALIKTLKEAGSDPEDLVAQIVGGASSKKSYKNIGEKNISIARQVLKKHGIRVISEDLGGEIGRKVIFDLKSGQLLVVKVHRIRETDWVKDIPQD